MSVTEEKVLKWAKEIILIERETLGGVVNALGESFLNAVEVIEKCTGKLVFTGVGKSAIVAQKLCGTFNSLGIASIFLHAADAVHGDMGSVEKNDVIIAISKSGNTPEIRVLLPLLKNMGPSIVGITSGPRSFMAENCDVCIIVPVEREACPFNLTPTASVIAHLAVGDALAMVLVKKRGLTQEDLGRNHPGGIIGKKLYMKVRDVLAGQHGARPCVNPDTPLPEVIVSITEGRLGATVVMENDRICGIITDGDIRRMLGKAPLWHTLKAKDIMTQNPKIIDADALAVDALRMINQYKITQIIVTEEGKYAGLLHFHDLVREGII